MKQWIKKQREIGEVGKWIVLLSYVAVNVIFGIYLVALWHKKVDDSKKLFEKCTDLQVRLSPAVPLCRAV